MTSTTRERPILFSGSMVRAILDGRKTQTRRVIKPQPPEGMTVARCPYSATGWACCELRDGACWGCHCRDTRRCPCGFPGERLWVREVHWFRQSDGITCYDDASLTTHPSSMIGAKHYPCRQPPEDDWPNNAAQYGFVRRVSIHMPRWASRITLEVTGVRVERLQDISEADARAEGIADGGCLACGDSEPCLCENPQPDARDSFAHLWDDINAKRGFSWASNPWVWVIEFQRVGASE